jgi:hypothetical protein
VRGAYANVHNLHDGGFRGFYRGRSKKREGGSGLYVSCYVGVLERLGVPRSFIVSMTDASSGFKWAGVWRMA